MTLIAFSGQLGSGKDTAGDRMAEMVSVPSTQISFARPLKESAAALLDIPIENWEMYKNDSDVRILLQVGWDEAELVHDHTDDGDPLTAPVDVPHIIKEFTAREFLQRYGTESHREIFGYEFWVEQVLPWGQSYTSPEHLFYVTDCRFVNEATAVRSHGGYVVRVDGVSSDTAPHASEVPLPDDLIHFIVENNVRDDDFAHLDWQLKSLAGQLHIPLTQEALEGIV